MKICMSKIIDFPVFYNLIKDIKLPIKTLYKVFQLNQSLNSHLEFYKNQLNALILEYGERDANLNLQKTKDGLGILIKQESYELCSQRMEDLLNLLVEVPEIYFDLEEFSEAELTLSMLEIISPFLI